VGGEVIPAHRRIGSRLIPAAVSIAALVGVVAYPVAEAHRARVWIAVLAAAAILLLVVGLAGEADAVGLGVAAAGTGYVAWLALDGRPPEGAAPLVAAGLVLSAEFAYRSLAAVSPVLPAEGENVRGALTALGVAVSGGIVGLGLLGVAELAPSSGTVLGALAVAATVGAFVVVALRAAPLDSGGDRDSER
jgi:hypothetical protein